MARTIFTSLSAGGSYSAQCAHPATLPVTGERALSTYNLGGNSLIVTIPANNLRSPTLRVGMMLVREPSSHATTAGLDLQPRVAFQSALAASAIPGNGTERIGGTVDFTMVRNNTAAGGGGCTP
jgi:hypothetical protein